MTKEVGIQDSNSVKFFLVTFVLFCHFFTFSLLVPIEPQYVSELFTTDEPLRSASYFLGFVAAGRAVLELFSNPMIGSLSDCFGRRNFFLIGLVGTFMENVLKALFPNLKVIAITTVCTGLTAATATVGLAYIADLDPKNVSKNFGLLGVALGCAFITGPVVGGLLGVENMMAAYAICAGVELIAISVVLVALPESLPVDRRAEFSAERASPFAPFKMMARSRVLVALGGVLFCFLLAQNLNVIWALYTKYRFDWSTTQLGLFLGSAGLVAALSNGLLLRAVVDRLDEYHVMVLAFVATAVALVIYGSTIWGWVMFANLAITAFGFIGDPVMRGVMSKHVPLHEQGELQGALSSLHTIARIIGPLLVTALFGFFISDDAPFKMPGAPFYFFAAVQAVGLAILLFFLTPAEVGDTLRSREERGPSASDVAARAGKDYAEDDEQERLIPDQQA